MIPARSALGRLHTDRREEAGWCDEGRRELRQPLLPEPLQRRLQAGGHRCVRSLTARSADPTGHANLCVSTDLMMGLPVTEDLYSIFSKETEQEEKEKESQRGAQEQVSLLLQTYMQLLLPDDEKFHGGWALINCDMRSASHRWSSSTSFFF